MQQSVIRRIIYSVVLLAVCLTVQAGERDPALAGYFAVPLRIVTATGAEHSFITYLATTPQQRAHGLMFVRHLPVDHGMLFLHKQPQMASMWMKNTLISLDMLFIRSDGSIANIVSNTQPGALDSISASEPVTGVLELNAGVAKKLHLAPGDKVIYRAFTQPVPATKQ